MHYAAPWHLGILQEAVRRGGDCNRKNAHGATPLHFAASQLASALNSGAEALRILVRCEASPGARRHCASGDRTARDCRADPNAQDRRGATPLHVVYGGVEQEGRSWATSIGRSSSVGAGGPEYYGGGGERQDIALALLEELGADPNIKDGNGDTPLMLPIRSSGSAFKPRYVSLLLRHGADPDTRNNKGDTPLTVLVSRSGLVGSSFANTYHDYPRAIIRSLVKHGADPDLRDGRGDTPLIRAAKHKEDISPIMEALLAVGADPCLRDRSGRLAYDHAQADGRMVLRNAGGYPDYETGICVRDLREAEEREKELALDRTVRQQLQSCLKTAGFEPGTPDGLFGPRTRAAVRAWQAAQGREGIEAAGYFAPGETDALLEACRTAGPEPLCTGQTGSGCWLEVADQPGCHVWNPYPAPEETVTWSGRCVDGKVSGKGRVVWRFRRDGEWQSNWNEGSYLDGDSVDGHSVFGSQNGDVWEGPWVGGESHGLWVMRGSGGSETNCYWLGERADQSRCVDPADGEMQAAARADIRSGPGDEYERLGMLQVEARVTVTGESGGWVEVETRDGRGGFVLASALTPAGPTQEVGNVFRDCEVCPEMVVVPSGSYMMGSPPSEELGPDDERPVHRVTIGQPFAVGVYEVTFDEWDACVSEGGCGGYRPDDEGWGRGRHPVINASWGDAQAYVAWLSRNTGKEYRLLSESEWEYVARAGTRTRYPWGDEIGRSRANCGNDCGDGYEYTAPVGSFAANEFGLHDTAGNVWEWMQDCWNGSYEGAPADGSAWESGDCGRRVLRGGSWGNEPRILRSANRNGDDPANRGSSYGFRVARTLD